MEVLNQHACFGGSQGFYRHDSSAIALPMRFAVYLPPAALAGAKVPALLYLAGLTCTEETFPTKAGAQRLAAELGLALIAPDTSPRGAGVAGEAESWDLGVGAGFYLDATQAPWAQHWRMESYLLQELLPLLGEQLPIDLQRLGIFGRSMGGHGALTLALRHPGLFKSVSAFAPIANPMNCAWGNKAFSAYLGEDRSLWAAHDASALMAAQVQEHGQVPYPKGILIDQGLADKFLLEQQLLPEAFASACQQIGQPLTLRQHAGYDHGYYFIQSLMDEHLRHHAAQLA